MTTPKPPELLPCEVCVRAQFRVVNMVAGGESCGVCGTVQLRIRACPSDKPSTRDEALMDALRWADDEFVRIWSMSTCRCRKLSTAGEDLECFHTLAARAHRHAEAALTTPTPPQQER